MKKAKNLKKKALSICTAIILGSTPVLGTAATICNESKTSILLEEESSKKDILLAQLKKDVSENELFQKPFYESLINPEETVSDYYLRFLSFFEKNKSFFSYDQLLELDTIFKNAKRIIYKQELIDILYNLIRKEEKINGVTHAYAELVIEQKCPSIYSTSDYNGAHRYLIELIAYLKEEEAAYYFLTNDIDGLAENIKNYYCLENTDLVVKLFDLYNRWYDSNFWYLTPPTETQESENLGNLIKEIQNLFLETKKQKELFFGHPNTICKMTLIPLNNEN